MPHIELRSHQLEALSKMKNGCILNGGVGSGKSLTSLAYYFQQNGGQIANYGFRKMVQPSDLYIITTARKRDTLEWEGELSRFDMSSNVAKNSYKNKIVVDSWNNIKKYKEIKNAFFIFDEQRVVGYGTWTKSFLKIAKNNKWILLSATPGDCWMDYLPVFIANGFFVNKSDFIARHVVYSAFTNYPKIDRYVNEARLIKYRKAILIEMDFERKTVAHHEYIDCNYDKLKYMAVKKTRWNTYKEEPIHTAGEYCLCLRHIVNESVDRQLKVLEILEKHPKAIIFYSFDYELEILRKLLKSYPHAEWNGHYHMPLPHGDRWVYLVEYAAGNEGWNCLTTDTMIFYSQQYSYKVLAQACGRIDRLNTPYTDLYYYHLKSTSDIDRKIQAANIRKKLFNARDYAINDLKKYHGKDTFD